MNHNPNTVLEELNRLETVRQQNVNAKQRQFTRYVVRGEAEIVSSEPMNVNHTPLEVHLRDVSRGGVGFISTKELPINSSWHIIFFHHGMEIHRQPVVVRHCQAVGNGLYLVGSLFCVEAGLLAVLGVDTKDLHGHADVGRDEPTDNASFLPPSEVA